jgi:actin related protein 2/3 complex subunit 3
VVSLLIFLSLTILVTDEADIVDECLTLFRANVMFRNFEIKNSADRLLVYLTLYTSVILKEIEKKKYKTKTEGKDSL